MFQLGAFLGRTEPVVVSRTCTPEKEKLPESPLTTICTVVSKVQIMQNRSEHSKLIASLSSFLALVPNTHVMLLSEDPEVCDFAGTAFSGTRCVDIRKCTHNRFNRPAMPCVFDIILAQSETEDVVFVNSDVILFKDFLYSLSMARSFEKYVMVGRRINFYGDIDQGTLSDLKCEAIRNGKQDGDHAIDYFAFRKGDFPLFDTPYIVGNWRWDNVLLANFYKRRDVFVIDASETVTAIHQSNNERELTSSDRRGRVAGLYNDELARKYDRAFLAGTISYASVILRGLHGQIIVDWSQRRGSDIVRCIIEEGRYEQVHGALAELSQEFPLLHGLGRVKMRKSCLSTLHIYVKRLQRFRLLLRFVRALSFGSLPLKSNFQEHINMGFQ